MTTQIEDILDTQFHPSATRHVGILSKGGIITDVMSYNSAEETQDNLVASIDKNGFEPDADDARVFKIDTNGNSEEVWAYVHEE